MRDLVEFCVFLGDVGRRRLRDSRREPDARQARTKRLQSAVHAPEVSTIMKSLYGQRTNKHRNGPPPFDLDFNTAVLAACRITELL